MKKRILFSRIIFYFLLTFFSRYAAAQITAVNNGGVINLGGFENPVLANGTFQYNPSSADWQFNPGSGISANGSGFTAANPAASEGRQIAFLQGTGRISRNFSVSAGTYEIRLYAAQRSNNRQVIAVSVDGVKRGEVNPAGSSYVIYTISIGSLSAGTHAIVIEGLNPNGGDNTAFIDDVKVSGGISGGVSNWSSPSTWDAGRVPGVNDRVIIPQGASVLLDVNADIKSLVVDGAFTADNSKNLNFSTDYVMVHGKFTWGTAANPYTKAGRIVLKGSNPSESVMGMGTKMIAAMGGGVIDIHGEVRTSWTMLNATASAGATLITVEDATDWRVGDEIIITSTGREHDLDRKLQFTQTEKRKITSVSADRKTFTFADPLKYSHFGELQTFSNATNSWVLDERAEVGLLTRNLKVEGDASSELSQFGGHIMVMMGSKGYVSGVELYRMGQAGVNGRYPFHWHLGGNVAGQYIENASIHHSFQRAVTVHGVQNARVENNVCYDIKGHAIFLEDGIETNTLIKRNLVSYVHKPDADKVIRPSDVFNLPSRIDGPAGIWISHPTNDLVDNAVSSCGTAIWYALLDHPDGPSATTAIRINTQPLGNVDNNRTHSCYAGFMVDFADVDSRSKTEAVHYHCPPGQVIKNATSFHCMRTLWWRGNHATFENFKTANPYTHQGGNVFTFYGTYKNGLMVGHSANLTDSPDVMMYGTAMYDGNHELINVHFENFDKHDQALLSMIGGASKNLPLTMENCSKKNSRVMHASTRPVGGIGEFNVFSSLIHDKTGQILGAPGKWAVLDHPYLTDNTFTRIGDPQDLSGLTTSNKFARVRFVIHDITEQTKTTLYSDWGNGHVAHNRPLGPHWEMPVMVNSNRLYRFRTTDYIPSRMTISFGEARAGDRIRFFVEGLPAGLNIQSNTDWPYNNGTPLRRVYNMADYNAATDNVYYYANGTAYFHLVARYTNDERTENIMISTGGGQLPVSFVGSRPYLNSRHTPGVLVQAEHFDHGGHACAYFEKRRTDYLTSGEFPNKDHVYKRHGEIVDLTRVSPKSENFFISDVKTGEWWNYSYNIPSSGQYYIKVGVAASAASNGYRVLVNGNEVGRKSFGATSGFSTQVLGPVSLGQGNQVVRLEALSDGLQIDWLSIEPAQNAAGAPVISITQPIENQKLSSNASITATAYDPSFGSANGNGIANIRFELKKDNAVIAFANDNAAPYQWSINTSVYANGLYQLNVIASSQDNQSSSKAIAIAIENPYDCAGVLNGKAFIDGCGKCAGGTTGLAICADTIWEKGFELAKWLAIRADLSFTTTEETVELTATGGNAHFWSDDFLSIPMDDFRYFHIRMKNNASKSSARINWFPVDNMGSQGSQQYAISNGDSGYKDYVIDLRSNPNYKGLMKRVLLQATEGSTTGDRVSIDRIEFSRIDRRDCNGVWRGSARKDNCEACVGGNTGRTSAPGCDGTVCVSSPYTTAISLPGVLQAENFNKGGLACAYNDADALNNGGQYRSSEGVDIQISREGGYNVGWTSAGEWLDYTVNVASAGDYEMKLRVASPATTGKCRLEFNGVDKTGSIAVPATGGWQTYSTISKTINLAAGQQVLRFFIEAGGFNFHRIDFNKIQPVRAPYHGTPLVIPGTVEAEDFDKGGQAIAYSDADAANHGGQYRTTEGVDVEVCGEGGYNIGWVAAGEWLEYTVNVATTGFYKMDARVASAGTGGTFHVEMDGVNASGTITVPGTGGWQTYTTISKTVNLTAGAHVMRVFMETNGYNLDKIIFSPVVINGNGDGLAAQYFNGMNFEQHVLTRIDPNINFAWGAGAPDPVVNADQFSVRWVGKIEPRFSETYTFYINSDNGRRVWVNNQLIVDKWIDDWNVWYPGSIALQAGQKYDIRVEYFENNGGAGASLEWQSASQQRQVVPRSQLYSVPVSNPPPVQSCSGLSATASVWQLRNSWSDYTTGSTLTNENSALKVSHRQWGQNYFWLIQTERVQVQAGQSYTVNLEVLGSNYASIVSAEIGLASSYSWDAPILVQPVVVFPSGYSNTSFTKKTATITASASGDFYMVFKINLSGQPSQPAAYYFKNVDVCGSSAAKLSLLSSGNDQADSAVKLWPNPTEEKISVSVKDPSTIEVYDMQGKLKLPAVKIDMEGELDLSDLTQGVYMIRADNGINVKWHKIIKSR